MKQKFIKNVNDHVIGGMLVVFMMFLTFLITSFSAFSIKEVSAADGVLTGNKHPTGIAFSGTNMWVTDNIDAEVYKYDTAGKYTGTHWDTSAQATMPEGIYTNGTNIWIINDGNGTSNDVYKYDMNGVYTGVHWNTSASGATSPQGLTSNGSFFWVVNYNNAEVYKYDMNGVYTGVHFDTAVSGDAGPTDITTDGTYFWIADYDDNLVYKYDINGKYISNFDVKANNAISPTGIYTNGTNIWVASYDKDLVVKYNMSGVYSSDTIAPVVTAFTIPSTASSLTVAVNSFTATDAVGVTGYLLTETSSTPLASNPNWTSSIPTNYIFSSASAKTLYSWAKDTAGNVSTSLNASVTITIPDTTAPVVTAFNIPATSNSFLVPISKLTATDAIGVTGYLITETPTTPLANDISWTSSAPTSYTFGTEGIKTLYAWAKDSAGNISTSVSGTTTITIVIPDTITPTVTSFDITTTATSLTVPISTFTASDDKIVTGYLLTESSSIPLASNPNWTSSIPTNYIFGTEGAKTLYAWAKDGAGNISTSLNASVTITIPDTTAPVVTAFNISATSNSFIVPISILTASDLNGVTNYLISESPSTPSVNDSNWTSTIPTNYTFSSEGDKTLYSWAKDASGNISASLSASVTITLPDTIIPTVTAFTIPETSSSLSVPISSLTASDDKGVTGFFLSEISSTPNPSSGSWSTLSPTTYTFSSEGNKTLYAWAKDSAGNVSTSLNATVVITLPVIIPPVVTEGIPTGTVIDLGKSYTGNKNPTGITSDGIHMWVTDNINAEVYEFNMDRTYTGTHWDTSIQATMPEGIYTNGTNIWVINDGNGTSNDVYKYDMNGVYTGTHWNTSASGATSPQGLTSNGSFFWVVNYNNAEVYKYDMNGVYTGVHFDTAVSGDAGPTDITTDGTNFWIADYDDNLVYKYDMTGKYISNFDVKANNAISPTGIYTNGTNIWVASYDKDLVAKYNMSGVYVTDSSFGLDAENSNPAGTNIYNGKIYVTDWNISDSIYEYYMDGTPTGFKFHLNANNNISQGIYYNGTNYWVSQWHFNPGVYKYAADGTYLGLFINTVPQGFTELEGVYSDGVHFWVVDYDTTEVYIYNADGSYTGNHFDTGAYGNISPSDIVSDGKYFWILDHAEEPNIYGYVYKYNMDGTYTGIKWDATGTTNAEGLGMDATHFYITDEDQRKIYVYSK